MEYYGYHRVSTNTQHEDRGIKEIQEFAESRGIALKHIFLDKYSGEKGDRPEYLLMKNYAMRDGDTLIVTEVDRFSRNKLWLKEELLYFQKHNIRVMFLEIPTTLQDMSSLDDGMEKIILDTINSVMIEYLGAMAEAEMKKRRKRQSEGIKAKKARGEWANYGRPRKLEPQYFDMNYKRVLDGSIKPFELIKEMGIPVSTYYSYRKEYHRKYNIVQSS